MYNASQRLFSNTEITNIKFSLGYGSVAIKPWM